MKNKIALIILGIVTFSILLFLIFRYQIYAAGDIVEYYGMTESLLRHADVRLNSEDQTALLKLLSPAYFSDPQYYLTGFDGARYPVHFFLYSILLIPARIILTLTHINPLLSLPITNLIILSVTLGMIIKFFLRSEKEKIALIMLVFISPFLSFITWQGPDLLYMCLVLLALFLFFSNRYFLSAALVAIASWQSQPLAVLALFTGLFFAYKTYRRSKIDAIFGFATIIGILAIPYLYNLLVFGVLSPWTILNNGWTKLYGVGTQNMSFKKLFEQFFDLDFGLIWYAPILFFVGTLSIFVSARKNRVVLLLVLAFVVTSFFYQSNPAWHYGTSGYGPMRHIIFILPFFIYFAIKGIYLVEKKYILLVLLFIWQVYSLQFNGFLTPDFRNTLYHSPFALYMFNNYPELYNPTPEIFVDRTNHEDLDHPTSAVFKNKGVCKKAYILKQDIKRVINDCGYIPENYEENIKALLQSKNSDKGIYVNY